LFLILEDWKYNVSNSFGVYFEEEHKPKRLSSSASWFAVC